MSPKLYGIKRPMNHKKGFKYQKYRHFPTKEFLLKELKRRDKVIVNEIVKAKDGMLNMS